MVGGCGLYARTPNGLVDVSGVEDGGRWAAWCRERIAEKLKGRRGR